MDDTPKMRTCANCPATSPVPTCKRRTPKEPWICKKCYLKRFRSSVASADGRALKGPCTPEMARKIADLVRDSEEAAARFCQLLGGE